MTLLLRAGARLVSIAIERPEDLAEVRAQLLPESQVYVLVDPEVEQRLVAPPATP